MSSLEERLDQALHDRYRLLRELGRGGMALVFLAEDLKHHRMVALKVLRPELAPALGTERFLREIRISAQLTHPNLLTLIDSGEADGFLYYVMPFVHGESLRDRLAREKQLPFSDVLRITREVAEVLGYAHGLRVVHRDIKPENILFEAGHAMVGDFGIARAVASAATVTPDRTGPAAVLTEAGLAMGTPAYMSPEQASASPVDGRSDIYSLGCVVYDMLGGEPPFTGPTPQAVMARHAADPPPRLRTLRPTVSQALEHTVERALAKVPADRFATAQEFAAALEQSVTSPGSPAAPRRVRWRRALALAVLLVLLSASGVTWLSRRSPGSRAGRVGSLAVLPSKTCPEASSRSISSPACRMPSSPSWPRSARSG